MRPMLALVTLVLAVAAVSGQGIGWNNGGMVPGGMPWGAQGQFGSQVGPWGPGGPGAWGPNVGFPGNQQGAWGPNFGPPGFAGNQGSWGPNFGPGGPNFGPAGGPNFGPPGFAGQFGSWDQPGRDQWGPGGRWSGGRGPGGNDGPDGRPGRRPGHHHRNIEKPSAEAPQ